MTEEIINIVTKPEVLLTGIVAPVIIFYFQKRFSKMFTDGEKKNRRYIWIKFISKYDNNIRDSLLKFQQIEAPYGSYKPFVPLIGLILGFFGFILLIYLVSKYTDIGVYLLPVSISLYFGIIMISMVKIEQYKDKIKKSEKFLERCEFVLNCITFIKWFNFSGILLSLPLIYVFYLNLNQIAALSNLRDIYSLFLLGFLFWVIIIISTYAFRKDLLNFSKYLLNLKYLVKFPHVHIKTITSLDFQGKICDVFNENLIILDDTGVKKAVEWHSVNYVELRRERFAFDYY